MKKKAKYKGEFFMQKVRQGCLRHGEIFGNNVAIMTKELKKICDECHDRTDPIDADWRVVINDGDDCDNAKFVRASKTYHLIRKENAMIKLKMEEGARKEERKRLNSKSGVGIVLDEDYNDL